VAREETEVQGFYTVTEAASLLGTSLRKVRRWIAEGKVPGAEKIGSGWRIPRAGISQVRAESVSVMGDTEEEIPFDHQVTHWDTREELVSAARQLERYKIPYVWKHRGRTWAIFRRYEEMRG